MNRLVKAQLALESRRAELGKLLDLEDRGEDYQEKVDQAKANITAAQADLETAGKLSPKYRRTARPIRPAWNSGPWNSAQASGNCSTLCFRTANPTEQWRSCNSTSDSRGTKSR